MPKRRSTASGVRPAMMIAREPMCFSWQTTRRIPSCSYWRKASSGCSMIPSRADESGGAMVGGR